MLSADEVVLAVCRLPVDARSITSKSAVDLIRQSGYLAVRSGVTVELLADCLREHEDYVEAWFRWSEDNRGSPAWYVLQSDAGTFQVGYLDRPPGPPPRIFTDKTLACAEYVHREVELIADHIRSRR